MIGTAAVLLELVAVVADDAHDRWPARIRLGELVEQPTEETVDERDIRVVEVAHVGGVIPRRLNTTVEVAIDSRSPDELAVALVVGVVHTHQVQVQKPRAFRWRGQIGLRGVHHRVIVIDAVPVPALPSLELREPPVEPGGLGQPGVADHGARVVAGLAERFGERQEPGVEAGHLAIRRERSRARVELDPVEAGRKSGQERGDRRHGVRGLGGHVGEPPQLGPAPIERRRGRPAVAVERQAIGAQRVNDDQHHVR
jgi:hypothetical protein